MQWKIFGIPLSLNFFENNCEKITYANGKSRYDTEIIKRDIIALFNDFISNTILIFDSDENNIDEIHQYIEENSSKDILKNIFLNHKKAYNFLKEMGNIIAKKDEIDKIKKGDVN